MFGKQSVEKKGGHFKQRISIKANRYEVITLSHPHYENISRVLNSDLQGHGYPGEAFAVQISLCHNNHILSSPSL